MVPRIFQDLSGFGSIENDILKKTQGYIRENVTQIRGLEAGTIGNKILNIATGLIIAKGVQKYYQDNEENMKKYEQYFDLAKEIRDFYKKKNLEPGVIDKIYLGELNVENLNLAEFLDIGQRFKEMEKSKNGENLNSHENNSKSTENTKRMPELTEKENLFLQNIGGNLENAFAGLSVKINQEMIENAKGYVRENITQIRNLDNIKSIEYRISKTAVGFIILEGNKKWHSLSTVNNPHHEWHKLCSEIYSLVPEYDRPLQLKIANVDMNGKVSLEDLYATGNQLAELKTRNANKKL
jgi:hypothetical protein